MKQTEQKTFGITDTKLYVAAITLSIQDNEKLQKQLKSGLPLNQQLIVIKI